MYVGAYYGGIWKTSDGAQTWQSLNQGFSPGIQQGPISDITVAPTSGSIYVVVSGIYKSVDHGVSWKSIPISLQPSDSVAEVDVDPLNDQNLYVITSKQVLLASLDGGTTWSQLSTSCSRNLIADPKTQGSLYCIGSTGFLASTDGGRTWTVKSGQFPQLSMSSFVIAPTNPKQVYLLANLPMTTADVLYSSSDGGVTWTTLTKVVVSYLSTVIVNDTNPLSLKVTTRNGLETSADGGLTWATSTPIPLSGLGGLLVQISSTPNVLVLSWGEHLWRTQDGGATWVQADQGVVALTGLAVAADPLNPKNVYLATGNGGGLFKSGDGAKTWLNTIAGIGCNAVAVDPFNSNHVVAFCNGEEVSNDGGLTWVSSGLTNWYVYQFVFDSKSPGVVYAGIYGQGVMKSYDGGATWSATGLTGTAGKNVYSLAVSPFDSQIVVAGLDSGTFNSTDGGSTWTSSAVLGYAVAFDPNRKGNVYAAGNGNYLYKSTDSGASWSQLSLPPNLVTPSSLVTVVVDPKAADNLFAISFLGPIGWSPDGGTTWYVLSNSTLAYATPIGGNNSLSAIAGTTPETLYITSSAVGLVSLALQH